MVYENCKIYGPYISKQDKRMRVVLVHENGKKQTISYPKFLVEKYLNQYLSDDDTIDHIDGDFTNNDLSNLRVIKRSQHALEDSLMNMDELHTCVWCKNTFIIKGDSLAQRNRRKSSGFCSKKCTGQYGAWIQKGNPPLLTTLNIERVKYRRKSALKEILSVEEQNIGETLTRSGDGNTEA